MRHEELMQNKDYKEQVKKDKEFRQFAAKELTEFANDWAEEGVIITKKCLKSG